MSEPNIHMSSDDWNKLKHLVDLSAENASLKAEVERLTERNKFLEQIDSYLQGANENTYEKRCDELEAEVERLGEENKKRQKDMELLFASYKQALEDIRRLHWDLQTAKEGKPSV